MVFKGGHGNVWKLILGPLCLTSKCHLRVMSFWFWKQMKPGYGTEMWNGRFYKFYVKSKVRLRLKAFG